VTSRHWIPSGKGVATFHLCASAETEGWFEAQARHRAVSGDHSGKVALVAAAPVRAGIRSGRADPSGEIRRQSGPSCSKERTPIRFRVTAVAINDGPAGFALHMPSLSGGNPAEGEAAGVAKASTRDSWASRWSAPPQAVTRQISKSCPTERS